MTSYIDHHAEPSYVPGRASDISVTHSWSAHTGWALTFLYGPNHAAERAAMTAADLAAWARLGSGRSAA